MPGNMNDMADYLRQPVTQRSAPPRRRRFQSAKMTPLPGVTNDILQFQERERALFRRTLEFLKEVHSAS